MEHQGQLKAKEQADGGRERGREGEGGSTGASLLRRKAPQGPGFCTGQAMSGKVGRMQTYRAMGPRALFQAGIVDILGA